MNLPNKLTVLRMVMVHFFVFFMLMPGIPHHYLFALVIFSAASITDHLDGRIARSRGLITNFGKLMDPLADKILVVSALICMVALGLTNAWFVIIIVAREFLVTAIRQLAVESGERKTLPYVDVFCDGTAVRTAGELTYQLCRELLDGFVTITNQEVCKAIRSLWNGLRVITEPSGAMGLAALLQDWQNGNIKPGEKCLVVLSGANMDFTQMGVVASNAGVQDSQRHERFLQIPMETKRGQVLKYLESIPAGVQLTDVQYGRLAGNIQQPVFGVLATDAQFAEIDRALAAKGLSARDVTNADDVRFRMISYDRERLSHPVFFVIEFPERPGAFSEFMRVVGQYAHLCYFNYRYSGEQVGRALVGMEFESVADRDACRDAAAKLLGTTIQGIHELPDEVRRRVLDRMSPMDKYTPP